MVLLGKSELKHANEIEAEMRNKIQAPLLILDNLHKGKEVSKKFIETALKDIEELRRIIETTWS